MNLFPILFFFEIKGFFIFQVWSFCISFHIYFLGDIIEGYSPLFFRFLKFSNISDNILMNFFYENIFFEEMITSSFR